MKRYYSPISVALFCTFLHIYSTSLSVDSNKQKIADICAYNGPRTFLLSYPRSGNTWLRYCLEFLTKRPSFSRNGLYYAMQQPLAWSAGFELDMRKAPIEKVHARHEIMPCNSKLPPVDMKTDKLIFIVRNPKETIARFEHKTFEQLLQSNGAGKGYAAKIYFENFAVYEQWESATRMLVYYEDLLQNPREELEKLLIFLGEQSVRIDDFISEYEQHKAKAKKIYKDTVHGSNDVLFHSKKLSQNYKQQIDAWVAKAYPDLWRNYLIRYSECHFS